MIGTFRQFIGDFCDLLFHHPVTRRVQHRLILLHRIHDAFRVFGPAKRNLLHHRHR